ncbi:PKD domain-containing protein [Candidatus Woesearchaeota archaeon]|nr:PKD domain-containing protein [Candidatus Woesearchaeota archaeon]
MNKKFKFGTGILILIIMSGSVYSYMGWDDAIVMGGGCLVGGLIGAFSGGSCTPYNPTDTGDCNVCGSKSFGAKCSEYTCRSIGKNCVFEPTVRDASEGVCLDEAIADKNPPLINTCGVVDIGTMQVKQDIVQFNRGRQALPRSFALLPTYNPDTGIQGQGAGTLPSGIPPGINGCDVKDLVEDKKYGLILTTDKVSNCRMSPIPERGLFGVNLQEGVTSSMSEDNKYDKILENMRDKKVGLLQTLYNGKDHLYPFSFDDWTEKDKLGCSDDDGCVFYVQCSDFFGNDNNEDYFVRFRLTDGVGDTDPPVIHLFNPKDEGQSSDVYTLPSSESNAVTIGFIVSDLSGVESCRYSDEFIGFDAMQQQVNCGDISAEGSSNLPSGYSGSFFKSCSLDVNVNDGVNNYYFACKDEGNNRNPVPYGYVINRATPLQIDITSPTEGATIRQTDVLEVRTSGGMGRGAMCSYSYIYDDVSIQRVPFGTDADPGYEDRNIHKQSFDFFSTNGDYRITVRCEAIDDLENVANAVLNIKFEKYIAPPVGAVACTADNAATVCLQCPGDAYCAEVQSQEFLCNKQLNSVRQNCVNGYCSTANCPSVIKEYRTSYCATEPNPLCLSDQENDGVEDALDCNDQNTQNGRQIGQCIEALCETCSETPEGINNDGTCVKKRSCTIKCDNDYFDQNQAVCLSAKDSGCKWSGENKCGYGCATGFNDDPNNAGVCVSDVGGGLSAGCEITEVKWYDLERGQPYSNEASIEEGTEIALKVKGNEQCNNVDVVIDLYDYERVLGEDVYEQISFMDFPRTLKLDRQSSGGGYYDVEFITLSWQKDANGRYGDEDPELVAANGEIISASAQKKSQIIKIKQKPVPPGAKAGEVCKDANNCEGRYNNALTCIKTEPNCPTQQPPQNPADCDNDRLDAGETCDGSLLNGKSCSNFGFSAGSLRCESDCSGFDVSSCGSSTQPIPGGSCTVNSCPGIYDSNNNCVDIGDNCPAVTTPPTEGDFVVTLGGGPTSGDAPLAVTFNVATTNGNAPYRYSWDFNNDGNFEYSNVPDIKSRTYTADGDYVAKVVVKDSKDKQAEDTLNIHVDPRGTNPGGIDTVPEILSVGADPSSGKSPLTVRFSVAVKDGNAPYKYSWDYDNNGNYEVVDSSNSNPTRVYSEAGSYTVKVLVRDNDGDVGEGTTTINVIGGGINNNPVANAGEDQKVSLNSDDRITVQFDGSGSSDPDNDQLTYSWSNGLRGVRPSKVYDLNGKYDVVLTVDDNKGGRDTDEISIQINAYNHLENDPPTANAGEDKDVSLDANNRVEVVFDGRNSNDPEGLPLEYAWNFGDGSAEARGSVVKHEYRKADVFDVSLKVTDRGGLSNEDKANVQVNPYDTSGNQAPVANAGDDKEATLNANGRVRVYFDGSNSNDVDRDPLTYDWDFGDGKRGSGALPSNEYTAAGDYRVVLTVFDGKLRDDDTASVKINSFNADTDSDGIPDNRDNCPNNANADQADSDNDGIGNVCEEIKEEEEDTIFNIQIAANPTSGDAPLQVEFTTAVTNGNSPFTYSWDFNNDGIFETIITSGSIRYTYSDAGSYTAKVRAADRNGERAEATIRISVSSAGGEEPPETPPPTGDVCSVKSVSWKDISGTNIASIQSGSKSYILIEGNNCRAGDAINYKIKEKDVFITDWGQIDDTVDEKRIIIPAPEGAIIEWTAAIQVDDGFDPRSEYYVEAGDKKSGLLRVLVASITTDGDSDNDGDGLTKDEEEEIGTDPDRRDSDGDGFSDGEEVDAGTNPLDPNSKPGGQPGVVVSSLILGQVGPSGNVQTIRPELFLELRGGPDQNGIATCYYRKGFTRQLEERFDPNDYDGAMDYERVFGGATRYSKILRNLNVGSHEYYIRCQASDGLTPLRRINFNIEVPESQELSILFSLPVGNYGKRIIETATATVGGVGDVKCTYTTIGSARINAAKINLGSGALVHTANISVNADGVYNIKAECSDSAGQVAEQDFAVNVLQDKIAPEIRQIVTVEGNKYITVSEEAECEIATGDSVPADESRWQGVGKDTTNRAKQLITTSGSYYFRCEDLWGNEMGVVRINP